MKRNISNVGVLDIREATEESIAGIGTVSNIGAIVFSRKTAHLVTRVSGRNIGSSVEVPDGEFSLVTGKILISGEQRSAEFAQKNVILIGKLTIAPDVSVEMIQNMGSFMITGKVICPAHLEGAMRSKILNLTGKMSTYPAGHRLMERDITIDQNTLNSFADDSSIACLGSVNFVKGLDAAAIARKIKSLYVSREITCPVSLTSLITSKLHAASNLDILPVPDDFDVVDGEEIVTASFLEGRSQRKILWDGDMVIDPSVTQENLQSALSALMVRGEIYCPLNLKSTVLSLLTGETPKIYAFPNDVNLKVNGAVTSLSASFFKYQTKPTVFINTGVVNIDGNLSGELLFEKIAQFYNTGVINGTDDQKGAIEARLAMNSGVINGSGSDDDDDEDGGDSIGNTGYLKL